MTSSWHREQRNELMLACESSDIQPSDGHKGFEILHWALSSPLSIPYLECKIQVATVYVILIGLVCGLCIEQIISALTEIDMDDIFSVANSQLGNI